jgi:hypothetical protein
MYNSFLELGIIPTSVEKPQGKANTYYTGHYYPKCEEIIFHA